MEASEAYYACLTTNEYGSTYLDPVKCKAKNFDPVKVNKEQYKRILLYIERFDKVSEERGHRAAQEESVAAYKFFESLPKPKEPDPEVPTLGNVLAEPTHSSIDKAFKLIGHKIKLYGEDVEVIAVKGTKDGVFLEVEENLEGELIRYEIEYENDVVPL